jgi:pimeloyl-ACP methyl ester carboxylesterase
MPHTPTTGIYYELHGRGRPLFLAFPLMASQREIFGAGPADVLPGFLDRLTDTYQVLVADYPNVGRSAETDPAHLTVDRVCADMLEVADAAAFDRFAWWGSTFGAIVGLQLAARSDRVAALVCGGWPPVGGQFDDMLRIVRARVDDPPRSALAVLRRPGQYRQWLAFYESLRGVSETDIVHRVRCPRMVFAGADHLLVEDGIPLHIAATLRERRVELETLGWTVVEIAGHDSSLILNPGVQVPAVRAFLDAVT